MPVVEAHAPGTFCWFDLATTDPAAARAFYTELFGWRAEDSPMPGGDGSYTQMFLGEQRVGALYSLPEDRRAMGIPSHWKSYIAVDDVDAVTAKVEASGGHVDAPPFDLPGVARMAAVADSGGARFVLYEAAGVSGLQRVGEPGCYCWSELYTHDPESASAFYRDVLGWTTIESPEPGGDPYRELGPADGPRIAGMLKIQPEMGEMPPNWTMYLQVDDIEATLAKVESLGGKAVTPAMEVAGVGRFAVISDPTGGHFMVIELQLRE